MIASLTFMLSYVVFLSVGVWVVLENYSTTNLLLLGILYGVFTGAAVIDELLEKILKELRRENDQTNGSDS